MKILKTFLISLLLMTTTLAWSLEPTTINIEGVQLFCFTEQDVRDIGAIIIERNTYRLALTEATDDLRELREQVETDILPDLTKQVHRAELAEARLGRWRWFTALALTLAIAVGLGAAL